LWGPIRGVRISWPDETDWLNRSSHPGMANSCVRSPQKKLSTRAIVAIVAIVES
jgi:hypothetical protein